MKSPQKSFLASFGIFLVATVLISQAVLMDMVFAAGQITTRSLTLQAGSNDGGSKAGGTVNHMFTFTVPTAGTVGSIQFMYCTTAAGVCTTPTGMSTSSATLGSEAGATGFSMNSSTSGAPYLTRSPAAIAANTVLSYQLKSIVNPTDINKTFFVRISTFSTTNATGTAVDAGTVTASTAEPIILSGVMPESLIFCTGATIGTTGGVPDCATASSGTISFNQLFSPTDTATATSQMAASTNAGSGYAISVNGPTMSSGTNMITAMGTAALGIRGTSQFGMNLKANTVLTSTTAIGAEVSPASNITNYRGQAAAGYETVDTFKFTSGDIVANSYNGSPGGADAQIFTASYIVNVPGSQPAGTYSTTLTYICTPTF